MNFISLELNKFNYVIFASISSIYINNIDTVLKNKNYRLTLIYSMLYSKGRVQINFDFQIIHTVIERLSPANLREIYVTPFAAKLLFAIVILIVDIDKPPVIFIDHYLISA